MASLAQTTVLLDAAAEAGVPVLLIGGAGIGKSSKLRALAAARGIHQEIITASVHDPADFNGFPHLKDGAFEFEPPAWARRAAAAGTCRIVFDEINTAPHTVQAALLRVILEGVVGPLTLPGAQFIAAMNPVDIAVGGWELPPPMANRFLHVHVEPDLAEFIDGLLSGWQNTPEVALSVTPTGRDKAAVAGQVTTFLAAHPELLHAMPTDPSLASGAWPSPRSWENLVKILPAIPADDDTSRVRAVEGLIGRAAADAFFTWTEQNDLPDPTDVLDDPASIDWSVERGDRILAVLRGITSVVSSEPNRYTDAMTVLRALVDADRQDVAAVAVKGLLALRPQSVPADRDLLARFMPLLTRAGKVS